MSRDPNCTSCVSASSQVYMLGGAPGDVASAMCERHELYGLRDRIADLEAQRGRALSERDAARAEAASCRRCMDTTVDAVQAERDAARAELDVARERAVTARIGLDAVSERIADMLDDVCGMQPVMSLADMLTALEQRLHRPDTALAERDAALAALRALVDAMPRCDAHAPRHCTASVVPWADALTAALAVLEETP